MISATVGEGDAVARLFAERQRLEGWLAALDGRRASTPAHIYERVRSDYEGRLRGVISELKEHRSSVEAMVESMEQRLGALGAEEGRHQDDRSEAELRASIGELDEEQCRGIVSRAEEAVSRIAAERGTLAPELSRLREILASTGDAPRPAAVPVAPPPPAAEPYPAAASAPAPAPAEPLGGFDELEFLKSVVVEQRAEQSSAPAPAPEPARTAASAVHSSTPMVSSARVTGSVPAFLRDVPAEQAKTLKCQECGTMNYPTEWYCERCGAELAAL